MNIPKEVIENANFMSPTNIEFYKHISNHKEFFNYENFKDMDLKDHLLRLQSWPTFLQKDRLEHIKNICPKIIELVIDIPNRIFKNDINEMGRYFNLPAKIFDIPVSTKKLANRFVWRGDFLFSKDVFKCLEINSSANLGGLHTPVWEQMAANNPYIGRFLKEQNITPANKDLAKVFFQNIFENRLNGNHELNIVYLGGKDALPEAFIEHLKIVYHQELSVRKMKGNILFVGKAQLEISDDCVFVDKIPIHIIVEFKHGFIPKSILDLEKKGTLQIYNGSVTMILGNKMNLAVLSEKSDSPLYNEDEQEIIQKYIPWTRALKSGETVYQGKTVKFPDFALQNKDLLVLKPCLGLGGEAVLIGHETDPSIWAQKVEKVVKQRNWVIQEYMAPGELVYQAKPGGYEIMSTIFGFLFFGAKYGGCILRVMPGREGAVINAHQGADISVIFED